MLIWSPREVTWKWITWLGGFWLKEDKNSTCSSSRDGTQDVTIRSRCDMTLAWKVSGWMAESNAPTQSTRQIPCRFGGTVQCCTCRRNNQGRCGDLQAQTVNFLGHTLAYFVSVSYNVQLHNGCIKGGSTHSIPTLQLLVCTWDVWHPQNSFLHCLHPCSHSIAFLLTFRLYG